MRIAVAIGVVAVALAAAVWLHQQRPGKETGYCGPGATYSECFKKRSWEDPAAALIAIGGIAVAVGIGLSGRRGSSVAR